MFNGARVMLTALMLNRCGMFIILGEGEGARLPDFSSGCALGHFCK